MCNMSHNSTPHASPGNGAANQAGSFCVPKPPLGYDEQVRLMESRGLIVPDRKAAAASLSELNYYRLRGYWLTFEASGRFKPGTSFDDIVDVYELDSELRRWVWSALEPIEVKARTSLAHHLAMACGPLSYLDSSFFRSPNAHAHSLENVAREVDRERSSGVPCVIHNLGKYGTLPVWAAVEVMTLGTVSQLYGNLGKRAAYPGGQTVSTSVARDFGLKPVMLTSWLRHLTYVRNVCGHHSRLYNRVMTTRPRLLVADRPYAGDKQFPTLLVLMRIYQNSWPKRWPEMLGELREIVGAHHASLGPMGFPEGWERVLRG